MMNSWSMTRFAATVADALGAEAPMQADAPLPLVQRYLDRTLGAKAQRALIFNPDCIGHWFWQKYSDLLTPVQEHAPLAVPLRTMMPSVTPVCFGTMYTGVMPAVHGIQRYEKPVITVDSLFDSLPRSGKKVALLAARDSSMSLIFGGRPVDSYILPYDDDVNEKALELIGQGIYDVVVVYNQSYDDMIHRTAPEAPEAMAAAEANVKAFDQLCEAARAAWARYDSLFVWAPDHGNHVNWDGHGQHGEFREEDINVIHCFGAVPATR